MIEYGEYRHVGKKVPMALIDHILDAYRDHPEPDSLVLGTVVDLQGSGYRRPGARLLVREDGRHVGAISGGCLENDAANHARRWVEDGPQTVLFDTRSSQFRPLGAYGTGCEGIVHLFLQTLPQRPGQIAPLDTIDRLRSAGREAVLVTAYASDETLSDQLGTIGVVGRDDSNWAQGFPEHIRSVIIDQARGCLSDRQTRGLRWSGEHDLELRLLLEYVRPPVELVVVGTGRDAVALVQVAEGMNWRIRVVGDDPMKLDQDRFGRAQTHLLDASKPDLDLSPHSYVVQMTHNFELDRRLLPTLLESPAAYIGLLGPRRRTARLLSTIHTERSAAGDDTTVDQALDRLSTPVGHDLGGEDPYEVAVAIIAEIVADKNGRPGGSLSRREGSIHESHEVLSSQEVSA